MDAKQTQVAVEAFDEIGHLDQFQINDLIGKCETIATKPVSTQRGELLHVVHELVKAGTMRRLSRHYWSAQTDEKIA